MFYSTDDDMNHRNARSESQERGTGILPVGFAFAKATGRMPVLRKAGGLLLVFLCLSVTGFAAERAGSPVTYETIERPTVPLRAFVARIDLRDSRVHVHCPPAGDGALRGAPWPTNLETVSHVAEREGFELAVNGDFFGADRAVDAEGRAATRQYVRGKKAVALGNAVTDGKTWAKAHQAVSMLCVSAEGKVSIERGRDVPAGAAELISGNYLLVAKGETQIVASDKEGRAPRTAAGLSADGNTLILLVVDGRSFRSRGATMSELAVLAKEAGAATAFNLDGGGSTTLVRRVEGKVEVVNVPSDGEERPVANVLGVEVTR